MRVRWRTRALARYVAVGVAVILTGLALGVFAAGWYFSDVIRQDGLAVGSVNKYDLQIGEVTPDTVMVASTSSGPQGDIETPGVWGLEWDGGYAQLGSILEREARTVRRQMLHQWQIPRSGLVARVDANTFPTDPAVGLGLSFEEVLFATPLGPAPAWLVPGSGETWAILVHGRSAERTEALRILPTLHALGYTSLVIKYRDDDGAPSSVDRLHRFGQTEWVDLEAAVQYALDHGARKITLVGYSMGGSVVASFLVHSPLAARVGGVILDAPALDFDAAVRLGAAQRRVPTVVTAVAERLTAIRFGIDWEELNYLKAADRLQQPILLFHGTSDETVPITTSDALASARPDLVTYVRTSAGHVRSWNVDPDGYSGEVTAFLLRLGE